MRLMNRSSAGYRLVPTAQFKKDLKRIKKRGFDIDELDKVIEELRAKRPLDERYKDHALTGNYSGFRECHIKPDWLLIYAHNEDELILVASRTGSHADLFKK